MDVYLIYFPLGPQHSALITNLHVAAVFATVNIYAVLAEMELVKVQTQPIDAPQV